MGLELRNITKRFPGVLANDKVSISVEPGEVVALLGENGAGKSTLMNVLYGLYEADEGEIYLDGEPAVLGSPAESIESGIGMVHQHFMLVPVFTVAENVSLGNETVGRFGAMSARAAENTVRTISAEYGLEVEPSAIVETLPIGLQQRVEIIKVLQRDARYLVLDEPTAVLTPQEVDELFVIIEALKAAGKGIIFISHKLKEVLAIADRIVVMREGRTVGETTPDATTVDELASLMVGRSVELVVDKSAAQPGKEVFGARSLTVLDDRGQVAVDGIDLSLREGEIVGIAGVQGNGQTELVEALTGLRTPLVGQLTIDAVDVTSASPREMFDAGLAHVPEDRQRSGLVLPFTITENVVLNRYHEERFSSGVTMHWDHAEQESQRLVTEYDVRTPSTSTTMSSLSGGNQQKVIVAREFDRQVRVIVAAQPTRGIDVGSIEYIHSRIVAERDAGAAVLIVSSELDEVTALADRLLVMYEGRFVAEVDPSVVSTTEIGLYMTGSSDG